MTTRPLAQARQPGRAAVRRHRAPLRPGKGRGHDLSLASRRCCASSRPTRRSTRSRSTGCCARRSSARSSARPSTGSSRPTTRSSASRAVRPASRSSRAPTTSARSRAALDALLRQLALEIVADGEGAERVARLVVRGSGRGGGPGRPRRRKLAAREVRAARRRPELGPHPGGRRPGRAGCRPGAARPLHRGRPGRERRQRRARSTTARRRRLDEAMPDAEVELRLDLVARPARRRRSSSATSGTDTCRSTRSTRHERRSPGRRPQQRAHRDAAGVAPLHQGVLRQHDRDQVRRRGDGGGAPARGVRARRGAAQVRRA